MRSSIKEGYKSKIKAAFQHAVRAIPNSQPNHSEDAQRFKEVVNQPDLVVLDPPKQFAHGDFACNIAMQLAKPLKQNPRQLAQILIDHVKQDSTVAHLIDTIEIAGPGFINIRLSNQARQEILQTIFDNKEDYGNWLSQSKRRLKDDEDFLKPPVILEFVSANPTGPLHVGHGRQAALGDALAAVLKSQGFQVHKEFYYNDAGVQIQHLALSVQARAKGFQPGDPQWPESAYNGQYIADIAHAYLNRHEVKAADGEVVTGQGDANNLDAIQQFAVAYLRAEQDLDLQYFGVTFDQFYLESSLYTEGKVEQVVHALIQSGHTYEEGGALWLRTTTFGDDKDRVMRKSEGGYTYFVPDVAYHITKFQRGYASAVNIQGSDHHGTIARVRAGLQACGGQLCHRDIPSDYPEYVLHKMVTVMKNGQEVKISKRAGSYVTLRDLIIWSGGVDEQQPIEHQKEALARGRDAVRFFLVSRKPDTEFVFDVDLALSKSDENPVYYVQYAHARIHAILRQCEGSLASLDTKHTELLVQDTERLLIQLLAGYPDVLAKAANERAPHHVAFYLRELAAAFHSFYNAERVLIDQENLKLARLVLLHATATVLKNGLNILGVSAPDRM